MPRVSYLQSQREFTGFQRLNTSARWNRKRIALLNVTFRQCFYISPKLHQEKKAIDIIHDTQNNNSAGSTPREKWYLIVETLHKTMTTPISNITCGSSSLHIHWWHLYELCRRLFILQCLS